MADYTIEIEGIGKLQNAIARSPREVHQSLNRTIRNALHIIRPIMRDEAPRGKTGNLRANIHVGINGLEGRVGPNLAITPYAEYVHDGRTGPWIIRPKNKKALYWPGAKHPVKQVIHPGIKSNPFVERTYDKIKEPVGRMFQQEIDKWIYKFHQ